MGSSRLLVSFSLVVMIVISYEAPLPWKSVNASDVPATCYRYCNQTSESRHQCYKWCQELAHKDGYKVYGYPYSTNTRRVLAVLHEKGLSYDPITVDLKAGDQKKPHFLSLNPFGQVPVFLEGDLKLTESRAISEYIATVHRSRGSRLLNYGSYKAMATQTMWKYIESFEFDPLTSILTWEQSIKPMYGLKTDYKVVNETEEKLEKVLDIYEERLKKASFLASNSFTLADLYHLPNIQYLMDTRTKRMFENRPSVRRWVAEITARPAWKRACDVKAWYDKKKN